MESEVIFYIAGETAANSIQIKKSLLDIGITVSNFCFATDVKNFVKLLSSAVSHNKLIFIIGGLTDFSENNVIVILSKALGIKLKDSGLPLLEGAKILENCWGADGSFLESGSQSICVLPDEPEQIEAIMDTQLKSILLKKYNLSTENRAMSAECFLDNINSDIMMDLDSANQNTQSELSLDDIKSILPEDINKELFGETTQGVSDGKSVPSSPSYDKHITENKDKKTKVETKKSSDIIHEFPTPDIETFYVAPRHAAPEENSTNNVISQTTTFSVFEDPDIELSTIDLKKEAENRERMKLNTEAQNIVISHTQELNRQAFSSSTSSTNQKNDSGDPKDMELPEHLNKKVIDSDNKTPLENIDQDQEEITKQNQDKDDYNNTLDEELLMQSIKKSKTSILIDILMVVLILAAIGCAVYIYYKVFLG